VLGYETGLVRPGTARVTNGLCVGPVLRVGAALARAANERGELLLAGAFAEPADGAALVFKADDRSVAERFAASDPYVKEGLVRHWTVRKWTVVIEGGS
jgi:uncharacterized protein YciI